MCQPRCQAVNLSTRQRVKLNFDQARLAAPRPVAPRREIGAKEGPRERWAPFIAAAEPRKRYTDESVLADLGSAGIPRSRTADIATKPIPSSSMNAVVTGLFIAPEAQRAMLMTSANFQRLGVPVAVHVAFRVLVLDQNLVNFAEVRL
jgi:hypothetical protein